MEQINPHPKKRKDNTNNASCKSPSKINKNANKKECRANNYAIEPEQSQESIARYSSSTNLCFANMDNYLNNLTSCLAKIDNCLSSMNYWLERLEKSHAQPDLGNFNFGSSEGFKVGSCSQFDLTENLMNDFEELNQHIRNRGHSTENVCLFSETYCDHCKCTRSHCSLFSDLSYKMPNYNHEAPPGDFDNMFVMEDTKRQRHNEFITNELSKSISRENSTLRSAHISSFTKPSAKQQPFLMPNFMNTESMACQKTRYQKENLDFSSIFDSCLENQENSVIIPHRCNSSKRCCYNNATCQPSIAEEEYAQSKVCSNEKFYTCPTRRNLSLESQCNKANQRSSRRPHDDCMTAKNKRRDFQKYADYKPEPEFPCYQQTCSNAHSYYTSDENVADRKPRCCMMNEINESKRVRKDSVQRRYSPKRNNH